MTDSSAAPRVTLTVRGTVNNSDDEADIDGIQVSPGSLVFDGPTSRSLTVTLGQHYAGTVPDVTVCEGSSHFIVRDVRRNADGRQAIIDIEFDAVAGDGEPVHRAELCVTVGSDSVVVPMIAVARVAQWPSSVPLP